MNRYYALALIIGFAFSTPLSVSTRVINFPSPVSKNLDDGFLLSSAEINLPDIIISTSYNYKAKWQLSIAATDPFFLPNTNEKSASDLLWKISNEPESNYKSITESANIILSGYGSRDIELNFKLLVGWNDHPANYSLELDIILDEQTNDRMIKSKSRQIAR